MLFVAGALPLNFTTSEGGISKQDLPKIFPIASGINLLEAPSHKFEALLAQLNFISLQSFARVLGCVFIDISLDLRPHTTFSSFWKFLSKDSLEVTFTFLFGSFEL